MNEPLWRKVLCWGVVITYLTVQADPSGHSVQDSDVQFVVNFVLPTVIADFVAHPPPGA